MEEVESIKPLTCRVRVYKRDFQRFLTAHILTDTHVIVETPNCNYVQEHLVHQLPQGPQWARVGLCKIGADNDTITGPVDRLYLWKEWNTRTAVDASSMQALTLPCLPSTCSF